MAMPTHEGMKQALLIKRLRIVCLTRRLAPTEYEVRKMNDGKLVLLCGGKAVVIGDPVTRLCYMV